MNRREFLNIRGPPALAGSCGASSLAYGKEKFGNAWLLYRSKGVWMGLAAIPPLGDKYLFDQRPT